MEPKSKYLRLVQTVLASGGALIINTLITLLLVPVISATLGNDAYGFVTLGKNIAQYATMITAALNSFAARYIVVSYHREDYSEANTYFSSTVYGDLILGTGLFAVALVGICFLEKLLVIPADLVTDVKLLFLLVFLNFWLVTVTTAFSASAHIKNRLHVVGMFKTLAYVCEAAILVVCFRFFSPHVFYVGLGLAAASFILALTNVAICKRYTPELKVEKQWFSWTAIRRLVVDGVWTSLNSLGDALNSGLDLLVCNLMLTPAAMGQLAISKTFYAMFSSMFLLVGQAFEPMYLKSYAEDDTKTLMRDFRVAMKLSGMISNIVFAGYVALGMVFYKLWIPGEDIAVIYTLTVINNMVTRRADAAAVLHLHPDAEKEGADFHHHWRRSAQRSRYVPAHPIYRAGGVCGGVDDRYHHDDHQLHYQPTLYGPCAGTAMVDVLSGYPAESCLLRCAGGGV